MRQLSLDIGANIDASGGFVAHESAASVAPLVCACPICSGISYEGPGDGPVGFQPPSTGTAGNGLPVFSWDQVAAQLTRAGASWSAALGQPAVVTYAFRADPPGVMPGGTDVFSVFNATQIAFTEAILALWADVANITFVRVGSGTEGPEAYSNDASILFGNYSVGADGASAFAFYPWPTATAPTDWAGDVWINISLDFNANLEWGGFGAHTIAHEIGHAIGLAHPANYDALNGEPITYPASSVYWQDSRAYTVMSYFGSSGVGHNLNAFAFGPQLHDIAAAQRLYGANMTTRTDDTIYGFNSNSGRDYYTITSSTASPVFSIWDAGGNDTIDFSGYFSSTEIDLREEAFSSAGPGNGGVGVAIGNISIARGAVIENAIGGAAADRIIGNAAANNLNGRNGNDTINAGFGADTLLGGDGADVLNGEGDADFLDGGNHDDTLNGGAGGDTLYGRAANDTLDGGAGADTMYGGAGDDTYYVDETGDATFEVAGAGWDTVHSSVTRSLGPALEALVLAGGAAINGAGNVLANTIIGNAASNILNGFNGADVLSGEGSADTVNGGNGDDTLNGGDGADLLDGGNENDTAHGGADNDRLFGRVGDDLLYGDAGLDTLNGGDGADTLNGGGDADLLDGGNDDDVGNGGDGADVAYGRQGNDTLSGDAGNDTLYGGDGDDTLSGGADNDLADGGNGADNIVGGDGADTLFGRNGADTLDGGLGADTLNGGNDADTFVFSAALGAGNIDTIQSFSVVQDVIVLSTSVFAGIGIGALGANAFVVGQAATDGDDRIIYDPVTGALYFDADGDGAGAAIQFATLDAGLALTAGNFFGGP